MAPFGMASLSDGQTEMIIRIWPAVVAGQNSELVIQITCLGAGSKALVHQILGVLIRKANDTDTYIHDFPSTHR